MTIFDAFRYDGKRALVVGGATGMGAAAAELVHDAGAEVVVMDIADPQLAAAKSIRVDLADAASIDAAVDECGGPVHALFLCAGVADGTPGIERINFIGHRHMIDRLLAQGMLPSGSAIGFISSAAGLGWLANLDELNEYLDTPDFDSAVRWVEEHGKADYMSSKQAICAYVASQAYPLLKRGIRINAICPGPTDTPLAQANKELWLGFGSDYRENVGIEAADTARAGIPARLPVQRCRRLIERCHPDHRFGLHQLRSHRVLPCGHRDRQLPDGAAGPDTGAETTARARRREEWMDFELTHEQQELRDVVRSVLSNALPPLGCAPGLRGQGGDEGSVAGGVVAADGRPRLAGPDHS